MKLRLLCIMLVSVVAITACKKSFTERAALDTPTVDNYYNTPDQVRGATATLYGLAWFDFIDKGLDCIGEVRSGNEFTWDNQYSSFKDFTTTATDPRLAEAWRSLYKVIGWSNVLIKSLEYKKAHGVTGSFIEQGI